MPRNGNDKPHAVKRKRTDRMFKWASPYYDLTQVTVDAVQGEALKLTMELALKDIASLGIKAPFVLTVGWNVEHLDAALIIELGVISLAKEGKDEQA